VGESMNFPMGLSSVAHEEIGVEGRKWTLELPYRVPITHTHTMVRNPPL